MKKIAGAERWNSRLPRSATPEVRDSPLHRWHHILPPSSASPRVLTVCAALALSFFFASCSRSLPGVTSVTAVPNGTSIDLSWNAVAGATAYDVFLSTDASVSPTSSSQELVATGTGTVVSGLTTGTTYYIIVAATSLYGFSLGTASDVLAVQLTGAPANPAPVITAISASPSVAAAGSPVVFATSASDTDGDTLTYTWTVNEGTVAGPTANLNLYSWTAPSPGTPTTYTVGVQVTDGTTTASATTTVTVE